MKPATILPPIEILRECFDYNPETGDLTWKVRPREHFLHECDWKTWNRKTPGKIVGNPVIQRTTKRPTHLRALISLGGKYYHTTAHRIVLALHEIVVEPGMVVDHVNGDALDNRLENIRVCSHAENIRNNPGYRKNGEKRDLPKGVYKNGKKFSAQIRHHQKLITVGTYSTPEEASEAYEAKAKELHGEFYRFERL